VEDNQNGGTPPNESTGTQTQPDPTQNLKAEFNRKFDNLTNELRNIAARISTPPAQQQPQPTKKKLADLAITDEEAFESEVSSLVETKASKIIAEREERLTKTNQILASLTQDFPELTSGDHELTKRAVEIHNSMSPDEKANPAVAYKLAVQNAALELGIRPKSKRSSESGGDFSLSGSGSGQRRSQGGKKDLDPATEQFAQLMGLDTSDPKVRERIKQRANRAYTKWE